MHSRSRFARAARQSLPVAAALAATLTLGPAARADDVEQARTLFDQAVTDLDAGRLEQACPAIEQSFRLDPRPGTLFTLAECEAQRGRIATAVARYTEFLALYKNFTPKKRNEQKPRADTSTAQIAALAPHVPTLTLRLPAGAPADTLVKRDGQVVPSLSLGTALAVDPGEHAITTQVPGGPVVSHVVTLQKGEKKELGLTIKLQADPPADPIPPPLTTTVRPPPPPPTTAPPPAGTSPPPPPPPDTRAHRIVAISAGAVGVTGIVVGAVTGILAIDRKAVVTRDCTRTPAGYDCATSDGVAAGERLKELGAASTAGFVLGLAGLGAAGIVLLTMPTSRPALAFPSVGISLSLQGAHLQGAF